MTEHDQLSVDGTFLEHPFAELLTEVAHAGLDGSLRVSNKEKKGVFYFKKGRVAMAASNVRAFRLFEMLLEKKRLTKDELSRLPNIANDFELADVLQNSGLIDKEEKTTLFNEQIKAILIDTVGWSDGSWSFNSLARLRDGLVFDVAVPALLVNYGRCLLPQMVLGRFRTDAETFVRSDAADLSLVLQPNESAVLRIVTDQPRSVRDVVMGSGIDQSSAVHALYALWLGGLLVRGNWTPAFSDSVIAKMTGAKLELKQEARLKSPVRTVLTREDEIKAANPAAPAANAVPEVKLTLEDYLTQIETAETYYDVLGVEVEANAVAIKKSYFNLAKSFHPDHFHQEAADLLMRVQKAFTELTRAHETLKDEGLRESYNFKIRKELEEKRKGSKTAAAPDERGRQLGQALDNFERGFSLLMENDSEAALPFLARAVHFDPNNARFHAYFGKALSADETKRHKAEGEMQAALRLDPQNATFRIMLAEFFIQMKLYKRAEGELNRLLAVFPSNREARELLNSLKTPV